MQLHGQVKAELQTQLDQLTAIPDLGQRVDRLAAVVFGVLTTLASQIDLLRSELVEKGIDVRT